jgi:hypothetical protein
VKEIHKGVSEMDELKLKLSTKFMKNIVASLIQKAILKKVGHEVLVDIEEIDIQMKDGKVQLHTTVDAEVSTEEFMRIIKRMI